MQDPLKHLETCQARLAELQAAPGYNPKSAEARKAISRVKQASDNVIISSDFDIDSYDKVLLQLSGGKDSVAMLLYLIDLKGLEWVQKHVELWHQDIDGGSPFMDWHISIGYCKALAIYFRIKGLMQARVGGFYREMMRNEALTGDVVYQGIDNKVKRLEAVDSDRNRKTVESYPATAALNQGRWCSPILKIDVCARVIRNDDRFNDARTLVLTGERREESANRSQYVPYSFHPAHSVGPRTNRVVHQWRPVLDWTEAQVWDAMKRHGINPHPAYKLGFGRVSCMFCIFGDASQFRSAAEIDPARFELIANIEDGFEKTIKQGFSIRDFAAKGTAYEMDDHNKRLAMSKSYTDQIFVGDAWELPSGAYKKCGGPE